MRNESQQTGLKYKRWMSWWLGIPLGIALAAAVNFVPIGDASSRRVLVGVVIIAVASLVAFFAKFPGRKQSK